MKVTLQNLTPYQRRMPEPFDQLRLNAYGEGSLPWSFEAFDFIRGIDRQIQNGELEVAFEPDRLEKYLRGYFSALTQMDGVVQPSGRTYRAQYPTIQAAVDALKSESAPENRFLLSLPPEDFNENVDLEEAEYIYIRGAGFGIQKSTRIMSSSGVTVRLPSRNSGIENVYIGTTSPNPADAAVQCFRSATGTKYNETFIKDIDVATINGAIGVWVDQIALPGDEDNLVMIYAGLDGANLGTTALIDGGGVGGGFIWFLGGGGTIDGIPTGPKYGLRIVNGGFAMTQSIGINADLADPTAYAVDNDAGFFIAISGVTVEGFNIHRSGPGTTNVMREYINFGGIPGVPARLEAGSFNLLSKCEIDGFGVPFGHGGAAGWVVDPTATIMPISPTMLTSTGSIPVGGAPDQRPSAVGIRPIGVITFYAVNGNRGGPGVPGTGCMLEWNPSLQQWEDSTGAVHP